MEGGESVQRVLAYWRGPVQACRTCRSSRSTTGLYLYAPSCTCSDISARMERTLAKKSFSAASLAHCCMDVCTSVRWWFLKEVCKCAPCEKRLCVRGRCAGWPAVLRASPLPRGVPRRLAAGVGSCSGTACNDDKGEEGEGGAAIAAAPPPRRRPRRCRPYAPGRLCSVPSQSGEGVRSVVRVTIIFRRFL